MPTPDASQFIQAKKFAAAAALGVQGKSNNQSYQPSPTALSTSVALASFTNKFVSGPRFVPINGDRGIQYKPKVPGGNVNGQSGLGPGAGGGGGGGGVGGCAGTYSYIDPSATADDPNTACPFSISLPSGTLSSDGSFTIPSSFGNPSQIFPAIDVRKITAGVVNLPSKYVYYNCGTTGYTATSVQGDCTYTYIFGPTSYSVLNEGTYTFVSTVPAAPKITTTDFIDNSAGAAEITFSISSITGVTEVGVVYSASDNFVIGQPGTFTASGGIQTATQSITFVPPVYFPDYTYAKAYLAFSGSTGSIYGSLESVQVVA